MRKHDEVWHEVHQYDGAGDAGTYGNSEGLEILEDWYMLRQNVKRLDAHVIQLEERVRVITLTSASYRDIRHRFLEVCRQNILKNTDREGYQKFFKGNEAAHEGDAIADADLYISNELTDEIAFTNQYGMTPDHVLSLCKYQALHPSL